MKILKKMRFTLSIIEDNRSMREIISKHNEDEKQISIAKNLISTATGLYLDRHVFDHEAKYVILKINEAMINYESMKSDNLQLRVIISNQEDSINELLEWKAKYYQLIKNIKI